MSIKAFSPYYSLNDTNMTNSVVFIIHYCMYITNTLKQILKNKHSI